MASLEKRGSMWYSRIQINGEPIHRPLDPDKRVAEEMLGELVRQRNAGRMGYIPTDTSWRMFKGKFLTWSQNTKDPTTHSHDLRGIRYLEDYRPITALPEITPEAMEGLRAHLAADLTDDKGKSNINRAISALIAMMRRAEDWKLVRPQNWRTVGRFKLPIGRVDFYDFKEYDALVNKWCPSDYWRAFCYLGGRVGQRVGEIFNALKKDIDFDRDRVDIHPNMATGWSPKDYECRFVPLHAEAKSFFKRWFTIQTKSPYIMAEPSGWRPASEKSLAVEYKKQVLRQRGLMLRGSAHTLRHTFGAHSAISGISMRKLKEWMGHASIKTTMIYAHLSPEETEKGINLLP